MSVFDRTDHLAGAGHEQVVHVQDRRSGLRAIIALWSTALGPAVGGTRFYPYSSEEAALTDVLALSRAMGYKAACAGLALGGGKAVILGDPTRDKSEALLLAYGRAVDSLGGRYYTACDVGTSVPDMAVVGRATRYATGRPVEQGGAGDSSVLTAYGVYQAMRAAAQHVWGEPSLAGRRVGVEGVGKVGLHLVELLAADGARLVVSDVDGAALAAATRLDAGIEVADVAALPGLPLDVYAPCALGGSLEDARLGALSTRVVCGAANNQLAHPGIEKSLDELGVLYVPDYVANAGGLMQVADEAIGAGGFSFDRAKQRVTSIFDSTLSVLRLAEAEGVPPVVAADRTAERRIAAAAT